MIVVVFLLSRGLTEVREKAKTLKLPIVAPHLRDYGGFVVAVRWGCVTFEELESLKPDICC